MAKIEISDAIRYIGVDDHDLDLFESQYIVPNGMAYNSYLILDDKVAIMDTVDPRGTDEWMKNLEAELAGRTPDYLVVQHLEPDHSGSIEAVMEKYPSLTIVTSAKSAGMLGQFTEKDYMNICFRIMKKMNAENETLRKELKKTKTELTVANQKFGNRVINKVKSKNKKK